MTNDLHPDDDNLIEKLFAVPPEDRETVLKQITRDWKANRLWSTVTEWLILKVRMEVSPSIELAFNLGRAEERLYWVAHRAPVTGATPENLAMAAQKSQKALIKTKTDEARRKANSKRHDKSEEWIAFAREEASKWPLYKTKRPIHDIINDKLVRRGFDRKGASTIRAAIKGYRPK